MDTATHFAFGFGLAGLSQLDPVVSADPWISTAVLIGTVAGSQAPDADTLMRFRGNAAYIRHHRGLSHSVPAWFLWTGLISVLLWLIFPEVPFQTLAMWIFIAVIVHVGTDLFNSYGTQAFRPFHSKWVAWNIIHIFDPFLFGAHLAAIALWVVGAASPGFIFPTLYAVLALYYVLRTYRHYRAERMLPRLDPAYANGDRYTALPSVRAHVWNVVKRRGSGAFVVGELRSGKLKWQTSLEPDRHPAVQASRNHPDVRTFLSFTSYACPKVDIHQDGFTVRWIDARYMYRKQFPFLAVVRMDKQLHPITSYIGWISEDKLERRLNGSEPVRAT